MTRTEIEDALYSLLSARLGITTILEAGSESGVVPNRPTRPYVTIRVVSRTTEGLPDSPGDAILSGGQYLARVAEDELIRVSVNAYGDGATDALIMMRLLIQGAEGQRDTAAAGFGLVDIGDVLDLTGLDGAEFEERAQVDLVFSADLTLDRDEGYIDTVRVGYTLDRMESDPDAISGTIEVP